MRAGSLSTRCLAIRNLEVMAERDAATPVL